MRLSTTCKTRHNKSDAVADVTSRSIHTCDLGLEGTSGYVRVSGVFNCNEVIAGCGWGVGELVTLLHLATVQLNLGWTVHCDCKRTASCTLCVDDELALLSYKNNNNDINNVKM